MLVTYKISCIIDDLDYTVIESVSDDELEECLDRLKRKHEFKNVSRFDIKPTGDSHE